MIATRRRGYNKSEDVVEILHPNWHYFEPTTTEANQRLWLFYPNAVTKYILDGEVMTSEYMGASDAWGYIIVPTPGSHKIYAGQANDTDWNGSVVRAGAMGNGVLRPRRSLRQFHQPSSGEITKLIFIQSDHTKASGMTTAMVSNCSEILVPKEALDAWVAAYPALKDKFKGVKYKIIED